MLFLCSLRFAVTQSLFRWLRTGLPWLPWRHEVVPPVWTKPSQNGNSFAFFLNFSLVLTEWLCRPSLSMVKESMSSTLWKWLAEVEGPPFTVVQPKIRFPGLATGRSYFRTWPQMFGQLKTWKHWQVRAHSIFLLCHEQYMLMECLAISSRSWSAEADQGCHRRSRDPHCYVRRRKSWH